jgi:hypothetical protein
MKVMIPVVVDTAINSFFLLHAYIAHEMILFMVKTSEEMKRLVEDYIKITNIKYEDQTEKVREKSKVVEWQFHIGANVIVSKNANRDDRIQVNVNMRFPPEDAKLLVLKNPSFSKAIMEISEICTTCGVGHQWMKDKEDIIGLAIFSHVDEQILDRISFHNTWDNVARVSGHAQKILRANFSGFPTPNTTDDTIDKSMYG